MRRPGFEPESLAWKAKVLTRLDYRRILKKLKYWFINYTLAAEKYIAAKAATAKAT